VTPGLPTTSHNTRDLQGEGQGQGHDKLSSGWLETKALIIDSKNSISGIVTKASDALNFRKGKKKDEHDMSVKSHENGDSNRDAASTKPPSRIMRPFVG